MRWLTATQVAQLAGCDRRTVVKACREGKITAEYGDGEPQPTTRQEYARRSRTQVWRIDPASARSWVEARHQAELDRL